MNLSFITLAAVTVVCVAAACSCMFALLCEKVFRRNFGRFRLIFAMLFLCAAIVAVSFLLVFIPLPRSFTRYDGVYYGLLFSIAFIAVFFPKSVGVFAVSLYALYSGICFLSINSNFDSLKRLYEVSLSPAVCEINGEILEFSASVFSGETVGDVSSADSDGAYLYVQFTVLYPADSLLLPVRRVRLRADGVFADTYESETVFYGGETFADALVYRILLAGRNLSERLAGTVSAEPPVRRQYIRLDRVRFYPAVYGITPVMEKNTLKFTARSLF